MADYSTAVAFNSLIPRIWERYVAERDTIELLPNGDVIHIPQIARLTVEDLLPNHKKVEDKKKQTVFLLDE